MRPSLIAVLPIIGFSFGCIPLPGGGQEGTCPDFQSLVGQPSSAAPIRTGFATQESIRRLLGAADRRWEDSSIAAYRHTKVKGHLWIVVFRDGFNTYRRDYFLFLRFGEGGVLSHWHVVIQPYSDNNRYDYETELRKFVAETDPARCAPSKLISD